MGSLVRQLGQIPSPSERSFHRRLQCRLAGDRQHASRAVGLALAPGSLGVEARIRFVGRLYIFDIMECRPDPWTGLVLHPVHLDNCNNYWIRLWERDHPSHVVWGREFNDREHWIMHTTLPHPPRTGQWYDYQVRVLPGSRLKFYWNGELIFDGVDSEYTYSQGPVGMRLDYFDTILAETRVYQP
jgi:hypothetical protein